MDVNEDFVDMAKVPIDNGVDFLVVGAYALAAHGFPRTTGDIDRLVRPNPENAARVFRALNDFGAPVAAHGVTREDFEVENKVYRLGLPPRRIDILTSISGVSYDEAAAEAIEGNPGPVKVRFIGKVAMARNKLARGRPKDLVDAELLQSEK